MLIFAKDEIKTIQTEGISLFFAFPFVIAYNVMCFVVSVKSYATVSILLPVKTVPGTEFTHNSTQYNSLSYKSEQKRFVKYRGIQITTIGLA